jgi:phage-related protein
MKINKGIQFTNTSGVTKHSFYDWGLILTEQNIEVPKPRLLSIDIPGADGQIDFTEEMGAVRYKNRTLTFKFAVAKSASDWDALRQRISNWLHGKKMQILTWSDDGYYYTGRCSIDDICCSRKIRTITISCDCDPYKQRVVTTIKSLVSGSNIVTNERKTVKASLTCTNTVTVNGITYAAGSHADIVTLTSGDNTVTSSGPCVLTYREGAL